MMKKLFMFVLAVCLIAPLGIAQFSASNTTLIGDDGSNITVVNSGYTGPRAQGSLTTLFASNNGFAGNMFDITPTVDMSFVELDVNTSAVGIPCNIDVWWIPGTCVGNEGSPVGWTLLDSGTGTSAGTDMPTKCPLPNGGNTTFFAGQSYGIYVDFTSYGSGTTCRYTNGQNTYSNADLSLTTHFGKGTPAFTGSTFSPREWNGTMYYDDPGTVVALMADVKSVSSHLGGMVNFKLNGTAANAGRNYALVAGVSGTAGFALPGGLIVPVTYDFVTNYLISIKWGMGTLDGMGKSKESIKIPRFTHANDIIIDFAFFLEGPPWDFVSNGVEVMVKGFVPPNEYKYDDGSIENALGLTAGGDMCWLHIFDSGPGDDIFSLTSAFGNPNSPGSCPGAGTPITIAIWNDPTNDNDPNDAVFLDSAAGVLANPDTNTLNLYSFTSKVAVSGHFVVGCVVNQPSGNYPGPMDETAPTTAFSWVCGDTTSSFDYNNLANNNVPPAACGSIGFPCNWLLRAQN